MLLKKKKLQAAKGTRKLREEKDCYVFVLKGLKEEREVKKGRVCVAGPWKRCTSIGHCRRDISRGYTLKLIMKEYYPLKSLGPKTLNFNRTPAIKYDTVDVQCQTQTACASATATQT